VRSAPLFPLAVRAAVARVGHDRLREAANALARLRQPGDGEALHDFRVAVRRLRSLLRAYRRWLGRSAGQKVRRRLRRLGRTTNAGRDAEVQLGWVLQVRPTMAARERTGVAWLAKRLRQQKREAYRSARRRLRSDFRSARALVTRRLEALPEGGPPFRDAFVMLLREHGADLEARLTEIRSADDEVAAHRARISAKRLRYLLEPVQAEVREARTAVSHLRRLQDVLGELHDAHVLAASLAGALDEAGHEKARRLHALAMAGDAAALERERRRDERLGLVALAAGARTRIDDRYTALARRWLGQHGRPFFRELESLADLVSASGGPVERERKFLLTGLPDRAAQAPALEIEQGWLPGERLRERLRRVRENGAERYYRTVKLGAGERRLELEEETTPELFDALWPHTAGCRVAKARHLVSEGELTWEIDVFADRDLVLAEIELPAAQRGVTLPEWLAPHVVREVTDEPEYLNLNLAR
jgi:CHAD domain-containing protein/CYTH domain-containing protein